MEPETVAPERYESVLKLLHRALVLLLPALFAISFAARADAAVWYVNDTSTAGDSFTSVVGSSANSGTTPDSPKRFLNDVEPLIAAGDTIFVDAGIFLEADTFVIGASGVFLIGVDSNATVIDFVDSTPPSARAVYASGKNALTIRNLEIRHGLHGIWFDNVDTATIESVLSDSNGLNGIVLQNGSDRATIRNNVASRNVGSGIYVLSSTGDTITGNTAADNFSAGIFLSSTTNSLVTDNRSLRNTSYGVYLLSSIGNTVTNDTASSNSSYGFYLLSADGNTFDTTMSSSNGSYGYYLLSSNADTLTNSVAARNSSFGFHLNGAMNHLLVRNTATNNLSDGFHLDASSGNILRTNTADSNASWGFSLTSSCSSDTFNKNIWIGSTTAAYRDSGVLNNTLARFDFTRNWWSTVDSGFIRGYIRGQGRDSIAYLPFRLGILDTAGGADSVAPKAPDTVAVVIVDTTTLAISWAQTTTNEEASSLPVSLTGYRLYRAHASDTTYWVQLAQFAPGTDSYTDAGLTSGASYFYRVTAFDASTPENQSFYSDSVPGATMPLDTSVPNVWYVNDGSTTGDFWTTAVGSSANNGLAPSSPKRFLNDLEPLLSPGDTVFVDAGTYLEPDTVTITADSVVIIGLDSVSCIVDFNDTTTASARAIFASGRVQLVIRDLTIRRGLHGIWFDNVDTATVQRVRADTNGQNGFFLQNGSDQNTLTNNTAVYNARSGFALTGSRANTLAFNSTVHSSSHGFSLASASNGNLLATNTSSKNLGSGFNLDASNGNVISNNVADSNLSWGFSVDNGSSSDTFQRNIWVSSTILASRDSAVFNNTANRIDVTRNWWGTVDSGIIFSRIQGAGRDSVSYLPFRLGIVDTTPGADTVAPRAPDTVAVAVVDSTRLRVSWSAVSANEDPSPFALALTGYRIYKSQISDTTLWALLAQVGPTIDSFTDSGLLLDSPYFYRVTAFDGSTPENQSFYSDSTIGGRPTVDTTGPNVWYLNDTSLAGDFYTSATGATGNSGLFSFAPKRFLNDIEPLLSTGDTIILDAGTYREPDTFTILVDSLIVIGLDSASSIVDFGDSSAASARAVFASGHVNLQIRDIQVRNALHGVWFDNIDSSSLLRVRSDTNGQNGFHLQNGSDRNTITNATAANNLAAGFAFSSSSGNTLSLNKASRNAAQGFLISASDSNLLTMNSATQDLGPGFELDTARNNTLSLNLADSNASWGFVIAGASSSDTFRKNNWIGSTTTAFADSGALTNAIARFDFTRVWWSTIDSGAIRNRIQGAGRDSVAYVPFRLGTASMAPSADTTAPKAPDTIAAATLSDTSVRITWSNSTTLEEANGGAVGLAGYRVYRATAPDTTLWVLRGDAGAATGFTDSGLAALDSRVYRVTAYDAAVPENQSFFSDSIATGSTTPAPTPSSGSFPSSAKIGDSLSCRVTDTDKNTNWSVRESVTVTVTNNRTGETETLALTEFNANASIFGGNDTLPVTSSLADQASSNGRLFAIPGDTISIRYVDRVDATDSASSGVIVAFFDSAPSRGTFPSIAKIGDSIIVVIGDSDQDFSGFAVETVSVTATNSRTGEMETIVLHENGANAGYFGSGDTLPITGDATFAASGDGRLFAIAGDTITVRYVDPTDPADSIASAAIPAIHDSGASSGVFPASVRIGDSLTAVIRDSDQNFNGFAVETVGVTARNNRTGETETLVLRENGANAGYFGGNDTLPVTGDSTFAGSGDGRLFAIPGDTIAIRYVDPTDATDSIAGTAAAFIDSGSSAVSIPSSVKIGDSLSGVVRDSDQNFNGLVAETVLAIALNGRTGETETITFRENGANTGYFGGNDTVRVTGDATFAASGDGRLFALAGDTLFIRYLDPTDTTDSALSSAATAFHDSGASAGTFPASVRIGDSIVVVVTDTDQNFHGLVVETVSVTATNVRTGETEILVMRENGANSGYFGANDTLPITGLSAFAASGDGRLYVFASDTIALRYVDPTDTSDSLAAAVAVVQRAVAARAAFPPSIRVGDSITAIITDTDRNVSGLVIETVSIAIANNRTGETEILVLRENGANADSFGGNEVLPVTLDAGLAASGNGWLFLMAGDTVTIRYVDDADTADSLVSAPIAAFHDSAPAIGVFPSNVKIGDSLTVVIRDSDQNFRGLVVETVSVVATNNRTGEAETFVLHENGANGGYFGGGDTLPVTSDATFAAPGDGRLVAFAGDTILIRYVDSTDASDSLASGLITAFIDSTPSAGVFPASAKIGDSLSAVIRDSDRNFLSTVRETVGVVVQNNRTRETESLALREAGMNSGYFGGNDTIPVTGDATFAAKGDGRLFVLAGDSITIVYTDPTDPSDATTSPLMFAYIDSGPCSGVFPPAVRTPDSLTAVIRDSDQNFIGTKVETVAVVVTNNRTGETETLTLRENGANAGYFGGTETLPISTSIAHAASASGTLYALSGDSIVIRYTDPTDPTDSCISAVITLTAMTTRSALSLDSAVAIGETTTMIVFDADQDRSSFLRETVGISIRNQQTGETETLVLTETAATSAGFRGSIAVVNNRADSLSGSGRLYARVDDTIVVTYADTRDASDSTTGTIRVASRFSGVIQQIQVRAEQVGADTYRLHFMPTGASGESLPALDGIALEVTVVDSVSGTGRLTDSIVYCAPESATDYYTRVERTQLFFQVRVLADSFFPSVQLAASGESAPNIVTGRQDTTGPIGSVTIPDDHYDTEGYRVLVEPFGDFTSESPAMATLISGANSKFGVFSGRTLLAPGVRPEIQVTIRDQAAGGFVHNLDTFVTIAISYPDANNDGFVDGTAVSETTLQIFFLDETLDAWVLVPGATVDAVRNVVSAPVRHLTTFTLIAVSNAVSATGVLIYPNPFRPNNASADDGREYVAGDMTTGIIMDNIPAGSRISVYTLLGERVSAMTATTGGAYQWDVKNGRGRPLASGQYVVIVEAPNGSRRIEKITVIR